MMIKQNQLNAGDFPLGSTESRAAARVMLAAKKRAPNIIEVTNFARDPNLPPEFVSSFTGHEGQPWEIWKVSFQGNSRSSQVDPRG